MTDREKMQDAVRAILRGTFRTEDDKADRRSRWTSVAAVAVEIYAGDILEIGALAGDSTVEFCKIAERTGRKVIVVDPWIAPTHNVAGWEKAEFERRTARWQEDGTLTVLEAKSQNGDIIKYLEEHEWAFALVDGSHAYTDVLRDISSVRKAGVICCDDMNMDGVRLAFDRALEMLGRTGFRDETLGRKWEGYIV